MDTYILTFTPHTLCLKIFLLTKVALVYIITFYLIWQHLLTYIDESDKI